MVSKKNFSTGLIVIACVFCNLSQMPNLMESGIISLAYSGTWIFIAVMLLIDRRTLKWQYLLLPIVFDVICLGGRFLGKSYFSSDLFRPINLCAFILLIGIWAGTYLDYTNLKKISFAFITSALAVAIYLYFNIFRGVDWGGSGYLYGSKNSAGQIFLVAIILIATQFLQYNKVLSAFAMIFFAPLIIMMKSRASILTLLIVIIYFILFILKKKIHKVIGIVILVATLIIIFTNAELYNLYIKEIILNNKDINDLTAVTSNRDLHVEYFKANFGMYWFSGTGGTYLESMPLAVLMSYGILGGIPVLLFSLQPLYIGFKYIRDKRYRLFCVLIIALSITMWINGIFEEQSPFGPGVKCYFLWLVLGLFIGYRDSTNKLLYYER